MNKIFFFFFKTFIFLLIFSFTACQLTNKEKNPSNYLKEKQYFLSPDGDDNNSGSANSPWKTLKKASKEARAGDIITLLPGNYDGKLEPVNIGTENAPIIFRAIPRLEAILNGPENGMTLILEDLKYIRLEGLNINPKNNGVGWFTMNNCSHITIDDCRMENSKAGMAAHINNCEHIKICNNVFHKHTGGINMLRISSTKRLLFEGNAISRAGHSPFQFYPGNTNQFMVFRGNIIHAAWGRNFEFFHDRDVIFENNIITHAFNSGWSGSSNAKLVLTRGIFRFNRIFHNPGGPIHLYPSTNTDFPKTLRLYNNVFDDNAHYGMAVSSRGQISDVLFLNNIFSRNDKYGKHCQVNFAGGSSDEIRMTNNVLTAGTPGLPVVHDYNNDFTIKEVEDIEFQSIHGKRYKNNIDIDPYYVDQENYNHSLKPGSPLINAGRFLTKAQGSGKGNLIKVEDAAFFFDGFGIEGIRGDQIAVRTNRQKALVIKVDHEANTLLLNRRVKWKDGDPVSLPWSGNAPDIGVYEHGNNGRVTVQIEVTPFKARPGEKIKMRALVRGNTKVQKTEWWLGDGNIAEGQEIRHKYLDEYDYAIRVRVTDKSGNIFYGSGYVWVYNPIDPAAPLIHSTWGPEDDKSWRLWKSYSYPGPAAYMDVVEGDIRHGPNKRNIPAAYKLPGSGINYRHVLAPEDKGGLPTRIHPHGWDIDLYPEIFIRYRISKGTPLALSLKPFGKSPFLIALSPNGSSWYKNIPENILYDDEKWHELVFDARKAREQYPDIKVMEGLYFLGSPQNAVKKGQWYDLDEVIIRPITKK